MTDDVLVVGPSGTGGIAQFITEQKRELADRVELSVYNRYRSPAGEGLSRLVRGLVASLLTVVGFPFRSRSEIVHIHTSVRFSFYRSACMVCFAKYVWDSRVILHVHGSEFDDFLETASTPVQWLQAAVFETVDDVIVLSESWKAAVEPHVRETPVHVVQNAIDPDVYEPAFGGDPVRLVYLSNLVERKGVTELLTALERLEERTDAAFTVEFGGDGPLADRVEAFAADRDHVTYHGYVSEGKKHELLSRGSVFVLPTYAEGLPIAMLEAMAGGNAVVSTAVGAIPEVIDDDNGVLIEPGNVDTLVTALRSLVEDPDAVAEMGRTNRHRCETEFAWDGLSDQLLEIYG